MQCATLEEDQPEEHDAPQRRRRRDPRGVEGDAISQGGHGSQNRREVHTPRGTYIRILLLHVW